MILDETESPSFFVLVAGKDLLDRPMVQYLKEEIRLIWALRIRCY